MYDCIISLKEWQVYCISHLHGPAFVYEEYIDCILVFIIRVCDFQKTNSDHFRKRKSCHATSLAIFWDSFSKILGPNLAEKMNGEHFDKINIKIVITYIPMLNYSLFGEFQIVGENLPKTKNDENLKKMALNSYSV